MRVYLVRHGESEGNAGFILQGAAGSLTEKGRRQAEYVAKRCERLSIDAVVASTMQRTRETAEIINKRLEKQIDYSDLFVERGRSKEEIGARRDDPKAMEAERMRVGNFKVPGYRYSDEENFDDLKARARKALEHLAGRSEDRILVVSHGIFARIIAAYAIFGEELTALDCERFIERFHMKNTAISVFELNQTPRGPAWSLVTWNDHAHLDEV